MRRLVFRKVTVNSLNVERERTSLTPPADLSNPADFECAVDVHCWPTMQQSEEEEPATF